MNIQFSDKYVLGIEHILQYTVDNFGLTKAVRLYQDLSKLERHIINFPEFSATVKSRKNVRKFTLNKYPFNIFFYLDDSNLKFLAILHQKMNNKK
jgi:plasmid stabilization system protein ParE